MLTPRNKSLQFLDSSAASCSHMSKFWPMNVSECYVEVPESLLEVSRLILEAALPGFPPFEFLQLTL